MFLVSMADIIGSYERLPNDAVRAVAVAKRREYRAFKSGKGDINGHKTTRVIFIKL